MPPTVNFLHQKRFEGNLYTKREHNRQVRLRRQITDLPTSLVSCSHFTLENSKSDFEQYRSYALFIIYLRIKRTLTVIVNLPATPEKCHRTTL